MNQVEVNLLLLWLFQRFEVSLQVFLTPWILDQLRAKMPTRTLKIYKGEGRHVWKEIKSIFPIATYLSQFLIFYYPGVLLGAP